MENHPTTVPENRDLTSRERDLLSWLFQRSEYVREPLFEKQIAMARVTSRCGCGCASIDFSIDGVAPPPRSGLRDVTDEFYWASPQGHIYAIFAYERANQLAGLEVYSIDGLSTPASLPEVSQLKTSVEALSG